MTAEPEQSGTDVSNIIPSAHAMRVLIPDGGVEKKAHLWPKYSSHLRLFLLVLRTFFHSTSGNVAAEIVLGLGVLGLPVAAPEDGLPPQRPLLLLWLLRWYLWL